MQGAGRVGVLGSLGAEGFAGRWSDEGRGPARKWRGEVGGRAVSDDGGVRGRLSSAGRARRKVEVRVAAGAANELLGNAPEMQQMSKATPAAARRGLPRRSDESCYRVGASYALKRVPSSADRRLHLESQRTVRRGARDEACLAQTAWKCMRTHHAAEMCTRSDLAWLSEWNCLILDYASI